MPSNWINGNRVMPISVGPYSPQATGLEQWRTGLSSSPSLTIGASNIYLYPVMVTEPYRVLRLWVLNGATTNGNWEVAIYSNNGAQLVTGGSVVQAGANLYQGRNIDYTLGIGSYWIGLATSSATATFLGRAATLASARLIRDQTMYAMSVTAGSAIPMPSSIVIGSNQAYSLPFYGIARAAL